MQYRVQFWYACFKGNFAQIAAWQILDCSELSYSEVHDKKLQYLFVFEVENTQKTIVLHNQNLCCYGFCIEIWMVNAPHYSESLRQSRK